MKHAALYNELVALVAAGIKDPQDIKPPGLFNRFKQASNEFISTGNDTADAFILRASKELRSPIVYDVGDEPPWSNVTGVHMPTPDRFVVPAMYGHVLIHELMHCTRHTWHRFDEKKDYVSPVQATGEEMFTMLITHQPPYYWQAREEFTAERLAMLVAEKLGVPMQDRSLNYLAAWIRNSREYYDEETIKKLFDDAMDEVENVLPRVLAFIEEPAYA